ncbi:MAG: polysaccharide ABC transporter ATP-binding protein [Aquificaceae bacterium]|jgi:ABC-type polysaccharide/polyol phosphate transport system ATPase subunit|uniref:ABC transporter ATP-binding protein n=1 Tax=Hydrogenobacter sp. Uz 6-8 TaxID=3384828 RepID=UPI00309B0288
MSYVLEAIGLTKIYKIYRKPADRLKEIITGKKYHQEHVALNNVSLKLKKGEVLGIIGENGAGKSTLLSILAGVLPPTRGIVRVNGKIAAILELGAGFHPDLSGYDNVFMYAKLIGMSGSEIKKKMDFIEDFSELRGFLDKPIKTYSTGMVVRLAFSTVLAVEPSIFIVDEALAVGDIHFQYKSFNALREYREKGGAIIFTSHSSYQVTNICDRVIWLRHGEVVMEGDPLHVVKEYEDYMREKNKIGDNTINQNVQFESPASAPAWISYVATNKEIIKPGESLQIRVEISSKNHTKLHIGVVFKRNDGLWVSVYSTKHENKLVNMIKKATVYFSFPDFPILHGLYNIEIYLLDETGSVIYDVKTLPLNVQKSDLLDMGVFRLRGNVEIENKPS